MENNTKTTTQKRVLYFVPQFPVLTETFISSEVSKLIEFGNLDISVFSMASGTGKMPDNVKARVHYDRLTLMDCILAVFQYIVLNPKKALAVHKLILGKDNIPYLLGLNSKNDLRTQKSVLKRFNNARFIHFLKGIAYARVFRKYSPDHIHAHFLSDSSTIVMVAAKTLGIPFSISAHAKDVFVEGTLIPVKAREASFIAVCNGNTWKKVVEHANQTKSSGKVRLLFHGVDHAKMFNVKAVEKPTVPFIFTVARLVEKKGLTYLIEASRILKQRNIPHIVKIAGPGPLYEVLSKQIEDAALSDTVSILGGGKGIPNEEIAANMKAADMFVLPFIEATSGDVDGVPYTVIEAALAKLPIVATSAGSMGDLITQDTGLLVEQKNASQLADAINTLIINKDLAMKLSTSVYEKAIKQFNIDVNVKELEQLLLS